jgi:hypothetical protein
MAVTQRYSSWMSSHDGRNWPPGPPGGSPQDPRPHAWPASPQQPQPSPQQGWAPQQTPWPQASPQQPAWGPQQQQQPGWGSPPQPFPQQQQAWGPPQQHAPQQSPGWPPPPQQGWAPPPQPKPFGAPGASPAAPAQVVAARQIAQKKGGGNPRLGGAGVLAAGLFLGALNVYTLTNEHKFYPKALLFTPPAILTGLWLLIIGIPTDPATGEPAAWSRVGAGMSAGFGLVLGIVAIVFVGC